MAVVAKLLYNPFGVRSVMNDSEGIDEIVWLNRQERTQILGITMVETDVRKTVNAGTLTRDLQ